MAKNINLGIFANDNIQQATLSLLSDLGIKMYVRSEQQILIPAVVAASLGETPKEIQDICDKISESYLAGIISEDTFNKKDYTVPLEDALENASKYNHMMVFAVDFKKEIVLSRTEIAKLTRILNRASKLAPVVLVCRYFDEEGRVALSLCERNAYVQGGHTGEKAGKVNILRGINPNSPHAGHIRILEEMRLGNKDRNFQSLYEKWFGVFETDILTDQFYKELQTWFYWASSVISTTQLNTQADKQSYTVKLLARIIMCWYVKEKRGINGEHLISNKILGIKNQKELVGILKNATDEDFNTSNSFYFGVLHNLFFHGLADYGKTLEFNNLLCDEFDISSILNVPYLNCSLFNKSTSDNIDVDSAIIPNSIFFGNKDCDGLLKILCSYKFTIEESTPEENDIALAPEMLGMVFENLLAEIDPRTKDTIRASIRKARGAYHTPDCILDEMVKDSLSRYLISKLKGLGNASEVSDYVHQLIYNGQKISNKYDSVCIKALYSITVLDPACGSGSFPLNLLNNIDRVISIIDPESKLWVSYVIDSIPEPTIKDQTKLQLIEATKESNRGYTRKLTILRDCIFGLDIQPLAIQITRLRFYLSLITDQKVDFSAPNYGIIPLPFLDTKFLCVDSLSTIEQDIDETSGFELIYERKNYYNATNKDCYITSHEKVSDVISKTLSVDKDVVQDWLKDPQTNLGLFKRSVLFPEAKVGFDIVIGNPPFGAIMSALEIDT